MKKAIVATVAILLGIGLLGYAVADPGHGRGGGTTGYGPAMMGPGMMGYGPGWMRGGQGAGRGFGPWGGRAGWMGRGPGAGFGGGPCVGAGLSTGETLTRERAETLIKERLAFHGNPNLKLGTVKEEPDGFVAEIVTKDNSLVDQLRIDKQTGFIRPVR